MGLTNSLVLTGVRYIGNLLSIPVSLFINTVALQAPWIQDGGHIECGHNRNLGKKTIF